MKIKDGHTDVASMRRLCKTIIEDCKEIKVREWEVLSVTEVNEGEVLSVTKVLDIKNPSLSVYLYHNQLVALLVDLDTIYIFGLLFAF